MGDTSVNKAAAACWLVAVLAGCLNLSHGPSRTGEQQPYGHPELYLAHHLSWHASDRNATFLGAKIRVPERTRFEVHFVTDDRWEATRSYLLYEGLISKASRKAE